MTGFLWIGPRWIGPRWAGSHDAELGRYESAQPDPQLSRAIEAVREDLDSSPQSRREIEVPPTRKPSLDPERAIASALTAARSSAQVASTLTSSDRLWRYDAQLRQSLIVQALTQRMRVDVDASSARCLVEGQARAILEVMCPTPAMVALEVDSVLIARKRRAAQLDEVLAQVDSVPVFFAALLGLRTDTHPNILELMQTVSLVVSHVLHPIKHGFAVPRPVQLDRRISPLIGTPTHYSFPAGHAAYAAAQAIIFGTSTLFPRAPAADLGRLAALVADNRVVAGVHYPMDGDGGFAVGLAIGSWLTKLAAADGSPAELYAFRHVIVSDQSELVFEQLEAAPLPPCDEWRALVVKAQQEWDRA